MKEDIYMNYGKKKVAKKQKDIASRTKNQKKKLGVRLFKAGFLCFLLLLAAACLGGFLFIKKIIDDAPEITAESVKPTGYITNVYADDEVTQTEQFLGSDANRVYKSLSEIPTDLQHAFVAVEDTRFYEHNGIDLKGIARAASKIFTSGSLSEGASTITQQLLKNSVFDFMEEDTVYEKAERKLQEQYLALQLEKIMSKDDILENYMNTINLGQNTLGVQAASLRYFNKDVADLTLSECSVIAGITQNPSRYNPINNPEDNAKRREKVLTSMLEQGYITQNEYDEAMDDDVYTRIQNVNDSLSTQNDSAYSYFHDALAEQVMEDLINAGFTETQAYNKLYRGGLSIYSTQSLEMQKICDEEINDNSNYSSNIKYGISYLLTVTRADGTVQNYNSNHIKRYARDKYNDNYGLIYSSKDRAKEVVEEWKATIAEDGDEYDEKLTLSPQPQSSATVIENDTGHIKALVGGRGDKTASRSLNRAYNGSTRQPGSTFKILAVYAPAIDTDAVTLADVYKDEPYSYANGKSIKNAYSGYLGSITVRTAIEKSVNIVAVKVITEITPETAFDYLLDMGFTSLVDSASNGDIVQSLGLGGITNGVHNYELTAAFAAIANHGLYNEPVLYTKILDHDGNVLLENNGQNSKQVLRESTADLLTSAMKGVITNGTASQIYLGNLPVAGKTGTTSDDKDVWFVGYSAYYTCGIWIGFDDPKPLTSDQKTHMKIWQNIMRRIHDGMEIKDFEMTPDIEQASICTRTGLRASQSCPSRTEYFAKSSIPNSYCSGHYTPPEPSDSGSDSDSDDSGNDNGDNSGDTPDDSGGNDAGNGGNDDTGDTGGNGGGDSGNGGGGGNSGDETGGTE